MHLSHSIILIEYGCGFRLQYASFCFNHSYISIHLYRARSAATEYNFAIGVFDFVDTHAYNKTGTVCLRLVMLSPTPQLGFWIHVLEDGMIELLPCEAGLRRHGGVKGVFDPPPLGIFLPPSIRL